MRKFLLLGCVALASLTASAQLVAPAASIADKSLVMKKNNVLTPKKSNVDLSNVKHKTFTKLSTPVAKAAAALPSVLIEDIQLSGCHQCDSVKVTPANFVDEDGTVYNVQLSFCAGYVNDIYGKYDSEKGTLTIPNGQYCYENMQITDTEYSDLYLLAVSEDGTVPDNMTLTDDGNGTFYLDQSFYQLCVATGTYANYYILRYALTAFRPANALIEQSIYYSSSGWIDQLTAGSVVDNEFELVVYNAFDIGGYAGCATLDVNDDGTVELPLNQNIFSFDELYGENYRQAYGLAEGSYLYTLPLDATYAPDRTRTTPIAGTKDGNIVKIDDYIGVRTDAVTYQGTSYPGGVGFYFYGLYIALNVDAAGVKGVTTDKVAKGDNKVYNLAGQVVGNDYKGIVIKNGKKFLKK